MPASVIQTACSLLASAIVVEEQQRKRTGVDERGARVVTVENTLVEFVEKQLAGESYVLASDGLLERLGRFGYEQLRFGAEHRAGESMPEWGDLPRWKRESWAGEAAAELGVEFDPERIIAAKRAESDD